MHHSTCGPAAWKHRKRKDKPKNPSLSVKGDLQPGRCCVDWYKLIAANPATEEQLGQVEVGRGESSLVLLETAATHRLSWPASNRPAELEKPGRRQFRRLTEAPR